ncbi:MAG: hypothetical protein R3C61_15610 [Bacteroidia bacterium]
MGSSLSASGGGQEADPEIYGTGNAVSYKYRVEDSRLGRFLSVDPLAPKYPFYSPYAFSGNKVIAYRELEGLEETRAFLKTQSEALGKIVFEKTNSKFLQNKVIEGGATISTFLSPLEMVAKGPALITYQNFQLPETDPTTVEYWKQSPLFGSYIHLFEQVASGDRFEETEGGVSIALALSPLLSARGSVRSVTEDISGIATIYKYKPTPGNRFGHYAVETEFKGNKVMTDQVITSEDLSTTTIRKRDPGVYLNKTEIRIDDAKRAQTYQWDMVDKELGPYDPMCNSWIDHVCNVLREGGVSVPKGGVSQLKYLKNLENK